MTPAKQIEIIHTMAKKRQIHWLKWVLVVLSMALLGAGIYTQHFAFFMGIALPALAAYSARRTAPRVQQAGARPPVKAATLYVHQSVPWPALVQVESGVFYPRDTPKPVKRKNALPGQTD